ncbi:HemK methyltransferase member 2, partial [Perkinsus olseni]
VIREADELHLVFEYLEMNLYQLLKKKENAFPEVQVRLYMYQTIMALDFMHKNGYFHRDLKPENLLVTRDLLKLADFGLAREIRSRPPFTDYVSTRWYRAPEVLLRNPSYNSPVDLWAAGGIMAELYTGRPLFPGSSESDEIYKICTVIGTPTSEMWPEGCRLASQIGYRFPQCASAAMTDLVPPASDEGMNFMLAVLAWDPSRRLTARQCLSHPFFADHTAALQRQIATAIASMPSTVLPVASNSHGPPAERVPHPPPQQQQQQRSGFPHTVNITLPHRQPYQHQQHQHYQQHQQQHHQHHQQQQYQQQYPPTEPLQRRPSFGKGTASGTQRGGRSPFARAQLGELLQAESLLASMVMTHQLQRWKIIVASQCLGHTEGLVAMQLASTASHIPHHHHPTTTTTTTLSSSKGLSLAGGPVTAVGSGTEHPAEHWNEEPRACTTEGGWLLRDAGPADVSVLMVMKLACTVDDAHDVVHVIITIGGLWSAEGLNEGRLQWMVDTLWAALTRPQGVEEFVILPVVNDYLIGGVDETDKGLLCSEGHIALSMKVLLPLHRGLVTAVATMRERYAVVAALTFPDCSDAWSHLATEISQSGAPLLLSVTRLTLLAHPKAGGDAWSFRESVLHTMPVDQWDIPAELNLIEAVAMKHDFAYYPWSHFGWFIRQLPAGDYPRIESFLRRMLRQTPRHSAPGHYAAEYFAVLRGLDGLPLVRKVWSMLADEHIRVYEGAAEACCSVVLRVAKASGRGSLGGVVREKMSSVGQLEEAPARVFRDALETLDSLPSS